MFDFFGLFDYGNSKWDCGEMLFTDVVLKQQMGHFPPGTQLKLVDFNPWGGYFCLYKDGLTVVKGKVVLSE